jgi:hypothetical protein
MAEEKTPRKEVAHDQTPAIISDHAFEPRGEWYTLCKHCGLAMPAHSETTIDSRKIITYSNTEVPVASRIGYYSDDDPDD